MLRRWASVAEMADSAYCCGAIEFDIRAGQVVGNVVPDDGRRVAQIDAFLKRFERSFFLAVVQQRAAEADLEFGAFGREHGGFVEFGDRFGIFVLFEKKGAEGRMGDGIERIDVELLAERGFGFGKFLLLLEREAEVIVGVLVGGTYFQLTVKCGFGFGELAGAQIGEAEIVEALLGFGIDFDRALEQRNGFARISGIERGGAGFDQVFGLGGGGNFGKAGGIIFDDEELVFVGFDGAGESVVIAGAGSREARAS